jgi:hypothetical protein
MDAIEKLAMFLMWLKKAESLLEQNRSTRRALATEMVSGFCGIGEV